MSELPTHVNVLSKTKVNSSLKAIHNYEKNYLFSFLVVKDQS